MIKITSMRRLLFCLITIGISLSVGGCKKNDGEPEDLFIKIYDDQDGNKHFHPLSIAKSTLGDGYITVNAFNGWRIQLMKTDLAGTFMWHLELPESYVNAVPNIITMNGSNYVICMDAVGLNTKVLRIDEANQTFVEVGSFGNVLYPTYAYTNGAEIYIQNYDRNNYRTGIHRLSADLSSITESGSVNIFTDVEERIVNHVTYNGPRIPFFISKTPEQNYVVMSGFYNFSFSLIFLNPDLSFAGVYNGAGFNGGLAAISPNGANSFSLARFNYDNMYYNSNAVLNPTTIDIAESIPAQGQSEIDEEKPVLIKEITISGNVYKAFLASSRSNQLVLSLFDKASGTLVGKKYIGKNIPLRVSDFIVANDDGIVILTQAKIMGSIDRIALIKISKEQLEAVVE